MKAEEFFPKVTLKKNKLVFNSEAVETMELDVEGSKVVMLEVTNPEKDKNNKEILIMKTNGSLCDDMESIKDVIPPASIREVKLVKENDDIVSGYMDVPAESVDAINTLLGDSNGEYKLIVCNTESALGKEFKEQFDITSTYYRFALVNDKRTSVGKEKTKESSTEERIKIN